MALGQAGQADTFGEVLAEKAIEILVGPTLPPVVRRREVDGDAGGCFDRLVVMKFGAIVGGHGLEGLRGSPHQPAEPLRHAPARPISELAEQGEAALALDERGHAVGRHDADHGVHFPMPKFRAVVHDAGALADRPLAGEPSPAVVGPVPFSPALGGTPELAKELPAAPFVVPDVRVDGFVADGPVAQGLLDFFKANQLDSFLEVFEFEHDAVQSFDE